MALAARALVVLLLAAGVVMTPLLAGPLAGQTTGRGPGPHVPPVNVERTLGELHGKLRITAAQQPAWDVFALAMRDNAGRMRQLIVSRGDPDTMTALEDLRSYAAVAEVQAQNLKQLLPAFEGLYQVLTPDQRRAADTAFRDFQRVRARRGSGN